MRLHSFHIINFRRLKDVHIHLEPETSIFVGANNSGKTSVMHIFQIFLGSSKERFSVYDFSADCWAVFDEIGASDPPAERSLPIIRLDLWFEVEKDDLHRVIKLLPSGAERESGSTIEPTAPEPKSVEFFNQPPRHSV